MPSSFLIISVIIIQLAEVFRLALLSTLLTHIVLVLAQRLVGTG